MSLGNSDDDDSDCPALVLAKAKETCSQNCNRSELHFLREYGSVVINHTLTVRAAHTFSVMFPNLHLKLICGTSESAGYLLM